MQNKVIHGVDPLPNDDELTALIEEEADPWGGGAGDYPIAIRNGSGQIYRVITAHGLGEFVRFKQGIEAIGFVNDLRPDEARDGFDAILRPE